MTFEIEHRLITRLKLRELRVLREIARHGSIHKAGSELALTQPAVSKTLSELEGKLGVRLFDRTGRGVTPTPQGEVLVRHAVQVFAELRAAAEELQHLDDPTVGTLRLCCSHALAIRVFPSILGELSRDYPRIRHVVVEAPPGQQLAAVRNRVVDAVLARRLGDGNEPDLEFHALYDEPLLIVAGTNHPLSRRKKISIGDLQAADWVMPDVASDVGRILAKALTASHMRLDNIAVVTMSVPIRLELLRTGRFLTTLPGSLVRMSEPGSGLTALPFKLPQSDVPVGITTLKGRTLPPAARLFVDYAWRVTEPLRAGAGFKRKTTSSADHSVVRTNGKSDAKSSVVRRLPRP